MLSKKDKEEIRTLFAQEFNKAMMRKITVERGPRKQGDPEKRIVEEEWNVLDWLVGYLPYVEGAIRGVQADVDKSKNKSATTLKAVEVISNILLSQGKGIKKLIEFSNWVEENQRKIEDNFSSKKILEIDQK